MRRIILFFCISLFLIDLKSQQLSVGDSAVFSLITCSPGEEVYSKFGHTAIRIKDAESGTDVVFNYGIFSFETNNFYYKFIKGETDYLLGVYDTKYFLPEYAMRNSMVWEQVLNLSLTEKRILYNILVENYEPQNRVYRYNFAFDNCSTRPRDKLLAALHGYVIFQDNSDAKTFRQWVGTYVGTDTWLKFGIDLVFGIEADRFASVSESSFLPEVLMSEFQTAQIKTPDGQNRKLVTERNILVEKKEVIEEKPFWLYKPISISGLLLLIGIIITIWDNKRKHHYVPFDFALMLLTGLGGLIVFYLMFFSVHPLVKYNLNILWLNPLNLIVAILVWIRPLRIVLFYYQILNILLLAAALFVFALSTQDFNIASFPIIVLLLMRSTSWFALMKRRIFKHRDLK
ncbi:MAG: DUF4105 domain-containing protein [Paludibacter sp.]|nr:DUF4105 domain-containing protein [Paludibacter sp.]